MKSQEGLGKHLTPDEIVARVFPVGEGAAPVPLHLAVCPECQGRVARLREASLLDRGAVDGAMEAIPEEFWGRQAASTMLRVRTEAEKAAKVRPFPFVALKPTLLRHPVVAFGSLAAAVVLVTGLTLMRPGAQAPPAQEAPAAEQTTAIPEADAPDDELIRAVDRLLAEETPYSALVPEGGVS
ncbi:MAG: hypothetical protein DYH06_18480 [Acidobacteria bacterium ACB2]|nr:hypothetical protein [Acidobacteria bacterium ACB2]